MHRIEIPARVTRMDYRTTRGDGQVKVHITPDEPAPNYDGIVVEFPVGEEPLLAQTAKITVEIHE